MIKTFLLNCEKENKQVAISFDIIDCSTLSENNFKLGLISKCSIAKPICENCFYKKLIGQNIDIFKDK